MKKKKKIKKKEKRKEKERKEEKKKISDPACNGSNNSGNVIMASMVAATDGKRVNASECGNSESCSVMKRQHVWRQCNKMYMSSAYVWHGSSEK